MLGSNLHRATVNRPDEVVPVSWLKLESGHWLEQEQKFSTLFRQNAEPKSIMKSPTDFNPIQDLLIPN